MTWDDSLRIFFNASARLLHMELLRRRLRRPVCWEPKVVGTTGFLGWWEKKQRALEISETRRSNQNKHLNFVPSSLPHPKVMVKGEWLLQFIKLVKVHHRKPWTQRPCFRPHLTSCARTACWAANRIAGVLEGDGCQVGGGSWLYYARVAGESLGPSQCPPSIDIQASPCKLLS